MRLALPCTPMLIAHDKEPVKAALNTAEAPVTILRLAVAIYPTGAWARSPQPLIPPGEFEESWQLRAFPNRSSAHFLITQRRPCSVQISFRSSSHPSAPLSRPFRRRCRCLLSTRRPHCGARSCPPTSRRSRSRAHSSRRSRSTTKTCGSRSPVA